MHLRYQDVKKPKDSRYHAKAIDGLGE